MAAIVDFGTANPERGIYGLYNDFYVRITNDTADPKFFLKYRIKVSVGGVESEYDVSPINQVSIIQPFEVLKDIWFRSQVIGLNGNVLDDSATVDIAQFGLNKVAIEVGLIYADAADEPPTFRGYDSGEELVRFYNGYENLRVPNVTTDYSNYLDPKWSGTGEVKLNHTILNREISGDIDDENKVFTPTIFLDESGGVVALDAIYTDSYNTAGVLDNQDIEPIAVSGEGYYVFNFPKTSGVTNGLARTEVYFRYNTTADDIFSQKVKFTQFSCNQNDRYRIRWINRYCTFEYLNCNGTFEPTNSVSGGKEILTDGIDVNASTFEEIKSVAKPAIKEFGKIKEVKYKLYTNFLTREEQLGLSEIIESPNTILYDAENNIIPVICTDTNFRIIDIKKELVKYELNFKSAEQGKILRR